MQLLVNSSDVSSEAPVVWSCGGPGCCAKAGPRQVATRLLAASPALYWPLAAALERAHGGGAPAGAARAAVAFFVAYGGVGCVLFSTFMPWT